MYETSDASIFSPEDCGCGGGGEDAAAVQALQVLPPSNQLTLSYQREVFVFDSIPPETVQEVLKLLGAHELSSEVAGMPSLDNVNYRVSDELPGSFNNSRRLASVMRYREKRKNLCFDKKIQYSVRKEVASRMRRHKGQFASSKANLEGALSPSSSCEPAQEETVSSFCHHCGTGRDLTPMMRRGPGGSRSLCNACGLMWANKGTLRSLCQSSAFLIQNSLVNPTYQTNASDSIMGGMTV